MFASFAWIPFCKGLAISLFTKVLSRTEVRVNLVLPCVEQETSSELTARM